MHHPSTAAYPVNSGQFANSAAPARHTPLVNKYYIPCSCGKRISVDTRQAGQTVVCECGTNLEVPTLRQLAQLAERVDPPPTVARKPWGPRERVLLFGLMLALAGIAWSGWGLLTWPAHLRATPMQTMVLWDSLARGRMDADPAPWSQYEQQRVTARTRIQQGLGFAALGLLVSVGAFLTPRARSVVGR